MKQNSKRPLIDHWLWEPPMLKVFVTVGTALPGLICGVLLLTVGPQGLHALWFMSIAPIIGLGYGLVGKKIASIREAIPPEEGVAIPSRIVRGKLEAAGIAVMGDESLFLYPVVGERSAIRLSEVLSIREVSFFNGSVLWGKTGFWLTIPDHSRLACAIPNSYAGQFRAWLSKGMERSS